MAKMSFKNYKFTEKSNNTHQECVDSKNMIYNKSEAELQLLVTCLDESYSLHIECNELFPTIYRETVDDVKNLGFRIYRNSEGLHKIEKIC